MCYFQKYPSKIYTLYITIKNVAHWYRNETLNPVNFNFCTFSRNISNCQIQSTFSDILKEDLNEGVTSKWYHPPIALINRSKTITKWREKITIKCAQVSSTLISHALSWGKHPIETCSTSRCAFVNSGIGTTSASAQISSDSTSLGRGLRRTCSNPDDFARSQPTLTEATLGQVSQVNRPGCSCREGPRWLGPLNPCALDVVVARETSCHNHWALETGNQTPFRTT